MMRMELYWARFLLKVGAYDRAIDTLFKAISLAREENASTDTRMAILRCINLTFAARDYHHVTR